MRPITLGFVAGTPVRASPAVLGGALAALLLAALVDLALLLPLVGAVAVVAVALLAHELAHAAAARHHGYEVHDVTLTFFGGSTRWSGLPPSPHVAVQVAAAGPAASATLACLSVLLGGLDAVAPLAALSAWVNVANAVVNLVPLPGTDGGRIVAALAGRGSGSVERPATADPPAEPITG